MARHRAKSWRFDATAYSAANVGTPLGGTPIAALWDPSRMDAMVGRDLAVHEESVLEALFEDLGSSAMEAV